MPGLDDPPPGSTRIEVEAETAASRVDRFLADRIPALSRSRIQSMIEAGQVQRQPSVPSGLVPAGALQAADPVPPGARYVVVMPPAVSASPLPQAMPLAILHEDADLLVLDKPAGLVVHPAPGSPDNTLVNALLAHCGDSLPGIGGEKRPGIVHRLDKDTSGVMVVAKSELALTRLSAMFAARDLDRSYVALCWGLLAPAAGEIEGAIGRDPRDRKRMAVVARGGKAALTRYATQQSWLAAVSLLHCQLATGRTHQIRVHLAHAGHAIVGDPAYGRRVPAVARLLPAHVRGALLDFPRQALHARTLGFVHPITGDRLSFSTPPPDDLQQLLALLQKA